MPCDSYDSCAQRYVHTYEQFLKLTVGLGLGLVLGSGLILCICLGLAFCVFFWFNFDYFVVCFCCVRFSFFCSVPRHWLGRTSLK